MQVHIIGEYGFEEALFGLGLSYGITSRFDSVHAFYTDHLMKQHSETSDYQRLQKVAAKLAHKDGGHNKFLETITVTLDITAPRYWHSEFDTYRVGTTKQSESTMHTIDKRSLIKSDFEGGDIPDSLLSLINSAVDDKDWYRVKQLLPESFLQRRIVSTNYKVLRNVYAQRKNHRLPEWHVFCDTLRNGLEHFDYLENYNEGK